MIDRVRLIIYKKKSIYDDILVFPHFACKFDVYSEADYFRFRKQFEPVVLRKKGINAYLVSIFVDTMYRSSDFRKLISNMITHFFEMKTNVDGINSVILIKLQTPKYQFLDYAWNEKLTRMLMIRQNIDNGMSWLSTLGGAFSSLGDQFDICAKIAGQISVEQFKLSIQLQDPQLIARCKIYAALSLLQQGYLKITRKMVKKIYEFAVVDNDVRLQRMCQGVWAKLKYCYSQRKLKNKQLQKSLLYK